MDTHKYFSLMSQSECHITITWSNAKATIGVKFLLSAIGLINGIIDNLKGTKIYSIRVWAQKKFTGRL